MDKELANRIWQRKFNNLMKLSNLPKNYWTPQNLVMRKDDQEAWDYLNELRNDIVNFVREGNILVITSLNVGNGKTSWAIRLLQRYIAETALDVEISDKGMFVNYATLLRDLGDFKYHETDEYKEFHYRLKTCEFLVIDELGSGKLNSVTYNALYEIINIRTLKGLTTVYTSNFNDEDLLDLLGERIFSRVLHDSVKIVFTASNVRGFTVEEVEDIEL